MLLLGLGDLGGRIALGLAGREEVGELVLAGRRPAVTQWARLATACGRARVRAHAIDLLDGEALGSLLVAEQPSLVLQCASLLSPWLVGRLARRGQPAALALSAAGFALQLSAQLPPLHTLMLAMRAARLTAPVINCSYPDVTHPLLATRALAPTLGIGNAGMIAALVHATLRDGAPHTTDDGQAPLVRVLAHHAHVTPVVLADAARLEGRAGPQIFVGDAGRRHDELAFAGPALPSASGLNALSAAHALDVARALLPDGGALRTSAPGPFGWAGGWPLRLEGGQVTLDLPPGVDLAAAHAAAASAALADGVAAIEGDGTVYYSDAARAAMDAIAPGLAAPLRLETARARAAQLRQLLELPS